MIQKIKDNPFAKNSVILFAGTMLANVLNYIFHLAVGRLVSVEVYGEIESLLSLVQIISVPALTLTMVATRYTSKAKAKQDKGKSYEVFRYMNSKVFAYGIPVFVFSLLITPIVSKFLHIDSNLPLIFIWITMFASFFYHVNTGILNGWQKFAGTSWASIWGSVVKLVFGVFFIKIGFELSGAAGSFALGAVASYFASLWSLKFILKDKKNDVSVIKKTHLKMKNYILPVFVGNLAVNILGNIDMVLAKHNLNPVVAGQYGALTIVSKIIFFATGVVATVLFSMAAEDSHRKNNSSKVLRNAVILMSVISVLAIFTYFVFPELILKILFGEKYLNVSEYLGWFAVMVVLFSFANLLFQYLVSIRRTRVVYFLFLVAVVFSFGILFLGDNIYAILAIISMGQIAAIITGVLFLLKRPKSKKC